MSNTKIQKIHLLELLQCIFIWEGKVYKQIKSTVLQISDKDQKKLRRVYISLEKTHQEQKKLFGKLCQKDASFHKKIHRKLQKAYAQETLLITTQEREEAESLLNFDDA